MVNFQRGFGVFLGRRERDLGTLLGVLVGLAVQAVRIVPGLGVLSHFLVFLLADDCLDNLGVRDLCLHIPNKSGVFLVPILFLQMAAGCSLRGVHMVARTGRH